MGWRNVHNLRVSFSPSPVSMLDGLSFPGALFSSLFDASRCDISRRSGSLQFPEC